MMLMPPRLYRPRCVSPSSAMLSTTLLLSPELSVVYEASSRPSGVEAAESFIIRSQPDAVVRIDQECHDLLSAVERGETAFARTEIDQSEPLPTAATEQSLFIPPTDGGDSEIRIGTKNPAGVLSSGCHSRSDRCGCVRRRLLLVLSGRQSRRGSDAPDRLAEWRNRHLTCDIALFHRLSVSIYYVEYLR